MSVWLLSFETIRDLQIKKILILAKMAQSTGKMSKSCKHQIHFQLILGVICSLYDLVSVPKTKIRYGLLLLLFMQNSNLFLTIKLKVKLYNRTDKGQLILKCPLSVFKSPKKPTKLFPGFLL